MQFVLVLCDMLVIVYQVTIKLFPLLNENIHINKHYGKYVETLNMIATFKFFTSGCPGIMVVSPPPPEARGFGGFSCGLPQIIVGFTDAVAVMCGSLSLVDLWGQRLFPPSYFLPNLNFPSSFVKTYE